MQSIFDAITEWIKELLIGAIEGNLSNMFGDVNDKVGTIAAEVGTTPQAWNSNIFSMIQTLSETVIIPIAGIIITYVLCVELIGMVTERNNLHDIDTFMFFKWFFKAWVAVFIGRFLFAMRSRSFPSFRGFGILPNKQFSPGQAAAEPGENTEVWLHFLCLLRFFFYYYYGEKCNFAKTPRTKRKTPQTIKFATLTKGT